MKNDMAAHTIGSVIATQRLLLDNGKVCGQLRELLTLLGGGAGEEEKTQEEEAVRVASWSLVSPACADRC